MYLVQLFENPFRIAWFFKNRYESTVKPVYKGHSWELENLSFISSCPLYTG
jgi:hypothetical protein